MKDIIREIESLSNLDTINDAQEMQDRLEEINNLCKEILETH